MKEDCSMQAIIHYVLAILEGGLSGGFFYCAGQEKNTTRKFLLYLCSALSFTISLLDSFEGGRLWKESRKAKALEINEGDCDDE